MSKKGVVIKVNLLVTGDNAVELADALKHLSDINRRDLAADQYAWNPLVDLWVERPLDFTFVDVPDDYTPDTHREGLMDAVDMINKAGMKRAEELYGQ